MKISAIWLALLACLATPMAEAQSSFPRPSLEAGISTRGFYLGPKSQLGPGLVLRAPLYFGEMNGSVTDGNGNRITGNLSSKSIGLVLDYHPGGRGFRLSAGVGFGGYTFNGRVTNPVVAGAVLPGTARVNIAQRSAIAPSLSVGYASPPGAGLRVVGEVGITLTSYRIRTMGLRDPRLAAEVARLNARHGGTRAVPFAMLGVEISF